MGLDAERIASRVREALASRRFPSASRVRVTVEDGVVHLSGTVMTYFERNTCEECCRRIEGVTGIRNTMEVEVSSRLESVADASRQGPQVDCETHEAAADSGEFPANSPRFRRGPGARISS
jgi:hypothetical protein